MDAVELREQAAALAQDGRNRLSGLVGTPPDSHTNLRKTYLRWHDEVETFVHANHQLPTGARDLFDSRRHRDLANDNVPPDELYANVRAERDMLLQLLDDLAISAEPATDPSGATPGDAQAEQVTFDSGRSYQLHRDKLLGTGGQARVIEGTDQDGQPVAIKIVPIRDGSTSRWQSDARLAERETDVLTHLAGAAAHILPLIDEQLTQTEWLIVTPRAEHSLQDLLDAGQTLTGDEMTQLLLQMAAALQALAAKSVVHRDIKPGNILRLNDQWVLGDLGIARILEQRTSTLTWAGTGTYEYWAPELFDGQPATVATDLYALGCTAFAALTGSAPFRTADLRAAHHNQAPAIPDDLDPALENVLRKLLAKTPTGRPPDGRWVEDALRPQAAPDAQQQRLLAAGAIASRRSESHDLAVRAGEELDRQRILAKEAFGFIWDELGGRAAVLPDATTTVQAETWYMKAADARLSVSLHEPSGGGSVLLIGIVQFQLLDEPQESCVANVWATSGSTGPVWELATSSHNSLRQDKLPIGPRYAPGGAGIGLGALDQALGELLQTGVAQIPPAVIERRPCSASTLLEEFLKEFEAGRPG